MNKLRMALRTTFSGWVFSTLWVFAAMPVTAVDYERAVPSRPPLPPSETVTIPATAFQPAPNARYEVSNGFLVTAGGYASFRYRLSLPAGALIQKVELIGSEPAGTGTMSLGLAWQDPPDQTWQWMTQVLTFQSRRESRPVGQTSRRSTRFPQTTFTC